LNDLASFDTNRTSWITTDGKCAVKVVASTANIKQKAFVNLPKEMIVEKCNKVVAL